MRLVKDYFIGSLKDLNQFEKKRIKKAFFGNTISTIVSFILMGVFYYLEDYKVFGFLTFGVLISCIVYALIRNNKIDFAILLSSIFGIGIVYVIFLQNPFLPVQLLIIPFSLVCLTDISILKLKIGLQIVLAILFVFITISSGSLSSNTIWNWSLNEMLYAFFFLLSYGIILLVAYNLHVNEKTYIAEILAQNKLIESQKNEIHKTSEKLLKIQDEQHKESIERLNQDLNSLSSNNFYKQSIKENIVQSLEKIINSEDLIKGVNSLILDLKLHEENEDRIDFLQGNIEEISSSFFSLLVTKYPQLSKTEREICAFIKLNLPTKKIAQLRNSSMNTIYVTKNRIRKKLKLKENIKLEDFIQEL